MNSALMFSKASDEWATPKAFFTDLDKEFSFVIDAAATRCNAKVEAYLGPDSAIPGWNDSLAVDWSYHTECGTVWLNPPYSRVRDFIAKAAYEARNGCTVVCLVPSRTDTRWWHTYVWNDATNAERPGVELRFIRGRLKFGDERNSAPFPSVVIIFRPPTL